MKSNDVKNIFILKRVIKKKAHNIGVSFKSAFQWNRLLKKALNAAKDHDFYNEQFSTHTKTRFNVN